MASFASLIRSARAATKEAKPFFSAVDKAVEEMPRNKGTGKEFLTELSKKPGVKKAELEDRGIKAALEARIGEKLTKDDVRKLMEERPPAQVHEKILTDKSPDYDEFLDEKAQDLYGVDYWELSKQEKDKIDKAYNELETSKYEQYQLPGGENYREILLKLPTFDTKRMMELEASIRRSESAYKDPMSMPHVRAEMKELAELKKQQAAMGDPYTSSHYRDDPNLLAHMRVSDRMTPEGKKVLHVEEIQSDWHQAGRKKGYRVEVESMSPEKRQKMTDKIMERFNAGELTVTQRNELLDKLDAAVENNNKVPDAPFKKNWHELAMKRLINYASENGYDSIAITPGAEQAKRYDLSKQIDSVVVNPFRAERGEYTLQAVDKKGKTVIDKNDIQLDQLDDYIGKELADRARKQLVDFGKSNLTGVDLEIGGEGMKGFYDKILPDYLRGFGKQYGADVGTMDVITKPENKIPQIAAPGIGHFPEPIVEPAETTTLHHFPITPQMREDVTSKGLPLYQKIGIPATGAGAGTGMLPEEEEPQYAMGGAVTGEYNTNPDMQDGGRVIQGPAFKRGGKVKFTDNPDTMYLEVNSKRK